MDFQTPPDVCQYMAGLVQPGHVLEPTPGVGNLVRALEVSGNTVEHPGLDGDFWGWLMKDPEWKSKRFDSIVMNPPFSPMRAGMKYLTTCMELTDHVVCLMPWFIMINSGKRERMMWDYGLKSITSLPRNVFPGSRIQCCIYELVRGWEPQAILISYEQERRNRNKKH